MEWKEVRLGDVCEIKHGFAYKGKYFSDTPTCDILVTPGNFTLSGGFKLDKPKFYNGPVEKDYILSKGDLIVTMTDLSKNIDTLGYSALVPEVKGLTFHHNQRIGLVENIANNVDRYFLYWIMRTPAYQSFIATHSSGTTVHHTSPKRIGNYVFKLPSLADQRRIASILSSLDRKIELNNKINADLEEMAQAIFKNWFVDFEPFKDGKFVDSELGMIPEGWRVGRADDFYQINIGKTPPRKEHKWFSTNPADKIWVSIANMGNSGIFISDSSEYLTKEAVDSHNIIMVPRNTILLSFKLTVGRVAIADKELTTNEAIARFILSDDKYMEYLYLYLKKFDYNSLGSTSSIATAVNSKTINGMQMLQPSDKVIDAFHIQVNPIFEKIRSLAKENSRLSLLRDTLLHRLMSGELEIPE